MFGFQLEASRRETAESSASLAEAMAEVMTLRESVSGHAVSQSEREALQVALKAAMAASEKVSAEAKQWRERSEQLEVELSAKANALSQTEAELAFATERVLEAEEEATEAKRLKAEVSLLPTRDKKNVIASLGLNTAG